MYKPPTDSFRKPHSETTFCSALMHKIKWRSQERSPSGDQDQRAISPKMKPETDTSSRRSGDKDSKNSQKRKDVKYVAKKIRRIAATIPIAIKSSEAYEAGVEDCETCAMEREGYKKIMQSIKIIELLVDSVIEKEQTELLDKENGSDDGFGEGDKNYLNKESSQEKRRNESLEAEEPNDKDSTDHNLKCILILLQKSIGDILVQISYVKNKNLGNDDKYKKFNVSISEIKLLKFEFTNLTHGIIQLFKKHSKRSGGDEEVCVACIKEKLTECHGRLAEALKSGKNLKVVMKDGKQGQTEDPCCTRTYPHVHAEAEGNPIVLKYSLSFQVQRSTDKKVKPGNAKNNQVENDVNSHESGITNSSRVQGATAKGVKPGKAKNNQVEDDYMSQQSGITNDSKSSKPTAKKTSKPVPYYQWPEEIADEPKETTQTDINRTDTTPFTSKRESVDKILSIESSHTSNQSNRIPKTQQQAVYTSISSHSINFSNYSKTTSAICNEGSINEMYCGCNWDKVYGILNLSSLPNCDRVKCSTSFTTKSLTTTTSSNSQDVKKRQNDRRVSFLDNPDKTVLTVEATQPHSVFNVVPAPIYDSNDVSIRNIGITPCKEINEDAPLCIPTVDSIILTKHRRSLCENPPEAITDHFEDKAVLNAFKQFVRIPEYDVHLASQTTPNVRDILPKCEKTKPENKKLVQDILRNVDEDTIRAMHSNPDCYNGYSLEEYGSVSNFPFPGSLCSLPLDQNDLNAIAAVLGEHISQDDIVLLPGEDTTDQMCVWETQYDEEAKEENNSKWIRAFAGTDKPSRHILPTIPETRGGTSSVQRSSLRGHKPREVHHTLPTIAEEVAFVIDDKDFHMPYVPSICSLPLSEVEVNELMKKKIYLTKQKTMELRYFTVEFPHTKESNTSNLPRNPMKLCNSVASTGISTETGVVKNSSSIVENTVLSSDESFHSCCSSNSELCTDLRSAKHSREGQKGLSSYKKGATLKAVDEMIMLNAIYLCDGEFEEDDICSNYEDFSKNFLKLTTDNIVRNRSYSRLGNTVSVSHFNPRKNSYTIIKDNANQYCGSNEKRSHPLSSKEKIITPNCQHIFNISINREGKEQNIFVDNLKKTKKNENSIPITHSTTRKSYTIIKNAIQPVVKYNIPNIETFRNSEPSNEHEIGQNSVNIEQENCNMELANPVFLNTSFKINKSYTVVKNTSNLELPYVSSTAHYTNTASKSNSNITEKLYYNVSEMNNSDQTNGLCESNMPNYQQYLAQTNKSTNTNECIKMKITATADNKPHRVESELSQYPNKCSQKENWSNANPNHFNGYKYNWKPPKGCQHSGDIGNTDTKSQLDSVRSPFLHESSIECRSKEETITPPKIVISTLRELLNNNKDSILLPMTVEEPEDDVTSNHTEIESVAEKDEFENERIPMIKPDFGFEKKYISVKHPGPRKKEMCKIKFELTLDDQTCEGTKNEPCNRKDDDYWDTNLITNSDSKKISEGDEPNIFTEHKTLTSTHCSSTADPKYTTDSLTIPDLHLGDHKCKAWFLYDGSGRPLTDSSGRLLRDNNGELLVICDEMGAPICDIKHNTIFDIFGRTPDNSHFNPTKPLSTDILKTLTTTTGDPMVVYDIKGKPLTSISGSMLLDSSGRGLIRFGSNGNPMSDLNGKPLFDINGEQIADI